MSMNFALSIKNIINSIFRNIAANTLATFLGMGQQFLTPILLLRLMSIDSYGTWLYYNSVSFFVTTALNGIFYALMNEIVIRVHLDKIDEAEEAYNFSYFLIIILSLVSLFGCLILLLNGYPNEYLYLLLSIFSYIVTLQYIVVDAQFRSADRFASGINYLTLFRLLDWGAMLAAACFDDAKIVILAVAAERVVCSIFIYRSVRNVSPQLFLALSKTPLNKMVKFVCRNLGQTYISISTACASIGPQVVVAALLSPRDSAMIITTRTYFRLTLACTNIITSAVWPTITQLFAKKKFQELSRLYSVYAVALTILGGLGIFIQYTVIDQAFLFIFGGKIFPPSNIVVFVACSTFLSIMYSICQILFVSTNTSSRIMTFASIGSVVSVLVFYATVLTKDVLYAFKISLCLDGAILVILFYMIINLNNSTIGRR